MRLPDLPTLAPETPVRIAIGRIDLLAATLECRYAGEPGATDAGASPEPVTPQVR